MHDTDFNNFVAANFYNVFWIRDRYGLVSNRAQMWNTEFDISTNRKYEGVFMKQLKVSSITLKTYITPPDHVSRNDEI